MQLNLQFKPRDSNVITDTSGQGASGRSFAPIHFDRKLTQEHLNLLCQLVTPERPEFPCNSPAPGRSVYATPTGDSWLLEFCAQLKVKGAFGLEMSTPTARSSGQLRLVFPKPLERYGDSNAWHIALNSQLRLHPESSKPKGRFTLGYLPAEREFTCQNMLSSCDAALPGILVGKFQQDGIDIHDCNQQPTGAVFIAHDPDAHTFAQHMNFLYIELSPTDALIARPELANLDLQSQNPLLALVNNYCGFMGRLAKIKSKAMFNVGVLRHSSHTENFFYNPSLDKTFQADHDTCLLSDDLPPELRVPQIIRDVCSTMQRLITDLALFSYSEDWKTLLKSKDPNHNIFFPYVNAIFHDFVEQRKIIQAAINLQDALSEFESRRDSKFLSPLANAYRTCHTQGSELGKRDISAKWGFIHNPFLTISIPEIYQLCRAANFPEALKVPVVDDYDEFQKGLLKGISELREKIMTEWPKKS